MNTNSAAAAAPVTETNPTPAVPKWIAAVLSIIESVQINHNHAKMQFDEATKKYGLSYAIEWRSADLVSAETKEREVEWLRCFLTNNKMNTEEMAGMVAREIENRREQLISCMRMAASTSAFANAIENVRLEARAQMFSNFNGPFDAILKTISKREDQ